MPDLRHATDAEAGEIWTVQRAAFVSEAILHDHARMPPLMQTLEQVRADIARQTVLVARDGTRLVGTVRGRLSGQDWYIGRLAVVPDRQGEGLGSRLLDAIEAAAPERAVRFSLTTGPRSDTTIALYERRGYHRVESPDELVHLVKPNKNGTVMSLFSKIDHVGIAVPDLDDAIAFYRDTFGIVSVHEEVNEEQGVREAMLAVGDGTTRIQLLAPLTPDSTIAKFIDRNGQGVQQVAYTVDDVVAVSDQLRSQGLRLLYDQPRRGTSDSLVNFIHPKDARGVLVELVQHR